MKGQLHIDSLFAFILRDADGSEGICAFRNPGTGLWMPMVGADLARVESLRPIAQELARQHGRTITVAFFKERHELEVITP